MSKVPKLRSPEFKLKIVLEALKGEKTIVQLASENKMHPKPKVNVINLNYFVLCFSPKGDSWKARSAALSNACIACSEGLD